MRRPKLIPLWLVVPAVMLFNVSLVGGILYALWWIAKDVWG